MQTANLIAAELLTADNKYDDCSTRDLCAQVLHQRQMPVEMRRSPGDFDPTSNVIKVMTMKVSKGLEFPVVAPPGVVNMPAQGEDEQEAIRVFYVAPTKATRRMLIGVSGEGVLDQSDPEQHRYNNLKTPPSTESDQRCLFFQG